MLNWRFGILYVYRNSCTLGTWKRHGVTYHIHLQDLFAFERTMGTYECRFATASFGDVFLTSFVFLLRVEATIGILGPLRSLSSRDVCIPPLAGVGLRGSPDVLSMR
jgi:hypothetical protein